MKLKEVKNYIIDFNKNIDRTNDRKKELEQELKNIKEYLSTSKKDKKFIERKKALIKELKSMTLREYLESLDNEELNESFSVGSFFSGFKPKLNALIIAIMLALGQANAYPEFSTIEQLNNAAIDDNGINILTGKWIKKFPNFEKVIKDIYNEQLNKIYDFYNGYRLDCHKLLRQGLITADDIREFLNNGDEIVKKYIKKGTKIKDASSGYKLINDFEAEFDKAYTDMLKKTDAANIDLKKMPKIKKVKVTSKEFDNIVSKVENETKQVIRPGEVNYLLGVAIDLGYANNKGKILNQAETKNLISNYFRKFGKEDKP